MIHSITYSLDNLLSQNKSQIISSHHIAKGPIFIKSFKHTMVFAFYGKIRKKILMPVWFRTCCIWDWWWLFSFTVSTLSRILKQDTTGINLVHGFIDWKVKINLYSETLELLSFLMIFFLEWSKFDRCIKNLSILLPLQVYSTLQNNEVEWVFFWHEMCFLWFVYFLSLCWIQQILLGF